MLIQLIQGHETFAASTIRVLAFYRRSVAAKEQAILDASNDMLSGLATVGSPEYFSASTRNTNNGSWTVQRLSVVESSLIKLFIAKKEPGYFIQRTKQVYLLMREQAALRRLRIPFTGNPSASLSCGYFEGHFDILTLEDAITMGIDIPDNFAHQFDFEDEDERESYYEVSVVEPETRPLVVPTISTVQTRSGQEVRVARNVAPRLIKIKRER